MSAWPIYRGTDDPHDGIDELPDPPNWRRFDGGPVLDHPPTTDDETAGFARRLGTGPAQRTPTAEEERMVNAALFLRRPLLITGRPGTGKSTLAYRVARELKLGQVLRWPITSRTRLRDGLYHYDPIGRLREENLRQFRRNDGADEPDADLDTDIGRHIRLGPLGTALLPYARPRMLLIDEIDKSDIDLPNDLLNVFEEGEFLIDELARLPLESEQVFVRTADGSAPVPVRRGRVRCRAFPFVVLTSNGERDFPTAFLRRCLRLDLAEPDTDALKDIIAAHLGPAAAETAAERIATFLHKQANGDAISTDQLLNAVYIATSERDYSSLEDVVEALLRPLTTS
ncbi:AAA family ATPase [Nocardia sp. NPDC058379]|uniref:AAA family ATPase n=1 Tax=unclassified Nocardia TaxID=2637762 RepID=UPI0036497AFE